MALANWALLWSLPSALMAYAMLLLLFQADCNWSRDSISTVSAAQHYSNYTTNNVNLTNNVNFTHAIHAYVLGMLIPRKSHSCDLIGQSWDSISFSFSLSPNSWKQPLQLYWRRWYAKQAAGYSSCSQIHWFIVTPPIQYVDGRTVVNGRPRVLIEINALIGGGTLLQKLHSCWQSTLSLLQFGRVAVGSASSATLSVFGSCGQAELTSTSIFMSHILSGNAVILIIC